MMKSAEAVHRGQKHGEQQPTPQQPAHCDWSAIVSEDDGGESSPLPGSKRSAAGSFWPSAAAELVANTKTAQATVPNKLRELMSFHLYMACCMGLAPIIEIGPAIAKPHEIGKSGHVKRRSHRHP